MEVLIPLRPHFQTSTLSPMTFGNWGTRIRTWVNGSKGRCPAAGRSPNERDELYHGGLWTMDDSRSGGCAHGPVFDVMLEERTIQ
jgi:hypothetical protein